MDPDSVANIFLNFVGVETYLILSNLCSLKNAAELKFKEIVKILTSTSIQSLMLLLNNTDSCQQSRVKTSQSIMGAFDEDETYWSPNSDPLNIDKEWRRRAETELKEDPEKAKENLKLLSKKLQDDKTLNSRMDDVFLMAFLRGRKHNVDSAYKLIKSYYDMKHNYPEFYRDALPSEKGHLWEMGYLGLIPGEDKYGHRLAVCIPDNANPGPVQGKAWRSVTSTNSVCCQLTLMVNNYTIH